MATTSAEVPGIRLAGEELQTSTTWTAWIFGVDERSLRYWADRGAPKVERGWWNPKELNAWLGKNGSATSDDDVYDEARKLRADIQYKEERVKQAEIERKALEGQYLRKDEVDKEWSLRVLEVKSVLMGLGSTLASQFTDADTRNEVRRVVNNEIQRALEQYSRDGFYTPEVRGNGELVEAGEDIVETAGETDVQPMG